MNATPVSPETPAGSRIGFVMTLLTVAGLTGILSIILVARGGVPSAPGAALVATALAVPALAWHAVARGSRRTLWIMQLASLFEALTVVLTMPAVIEPPFRMLRLAIVLAAIAGSVTIALGFARPHALGRAMAIGLGMPGLLLALDLVLGYPDVGNPPARREWFAAMLPDSVLGHRYAPDTAFATRYPDAGNGDHDPIDFRARLWSLNAADGNVAHLEFPAERVGEVRVNIEAADSGPAWHIQLNQAGLAVKALVSYSVRLRIRADSARDVGIGFLQAHAPWKQVGFYRTVHVDTTWQVLNEYFIAGIDDDDTRLAFDLGGSAVDVTITDVRMEAQDGAPLLPPLPLDQYEVRYALDRDGCRRSDTPTAAGADALLLLGDGDAMGVGIRARDTFAGRLADPDTASGWPGLPIRNCGLPGADPAVAEAWYRHHTGAGRSTTVLYVIGPAMVDRLHRHAAAAALRRLPTPLRVSALLARLSPPRDDDWREAVATLTLGIGRLAAAVRGDDGQLIVAYFRADDDRGWPDVISAVDGLVGSTGATTVDLGTHLADSLPVAALRGDEPGHHPGALAHRIAAEALRGPLLDRMRVIEVRK